MPTLKEHAELELKLAGLLDEDSDYNGAVGKAVLDLVEVFSGQGHSGGSAAYVIDIFSKVASYQNLMPITDNPEEWFFHGESVAGVKDGFWQNIRNGEAFSTDGGKTYYLLSEGANAHNQEPLHESVSHKPKEQV